MFTANGCMQIDDIAWMSPDLIRTLAKEAGLDVSIGLVYRVHEYVLEDVAHVKVASKLM